MKNWIKTNLSKITLALGLVGYISGISGLIVGSIAHNKTNDLQYFLDYDYKVHWGGGGNYMRKKNRWCSKITLYLSINPAYPTVDTKWDGIYPDGYFNK